MRFRLAPALLAGLVLSAASSLASAPDLKIGDAAPALKVAKFVKGEPVASLDPSKTYVLEFWATWCGPCIRAIPHVTELQAKHKDITFIGVNVWEQDESKVEPFVKQMGDKMNYRVAMDDKSTDAKGAMATTWLDAAGQDGIPCSMIVDKGKIVWIGHPMAMEPVLEKVAAGTFDIEAAKNEASAAAEKEGAMKKVNEAFQTKVGPFIQKKDFAGAAKAVDEIAAEFPDVKPQLLNVKFQMQLQGKLYDDAYQTADEVAAANNDSAEALNALAWTIVDRKGIENRDLDRALKYATRAAELTDHKEAAILDTLAHVYAGKGDYVQAIETETKAVEVAAADLKADLQKSLDEFKAKKQ